VAPLGHAQPEEEGGDEQIRGRLEVMREVHVEAHHDQAHSEERHRVAQTPQGRDLQRALEAALSPEQRRDGADVVGVGGVFEA